jgi:hypothetical protein
MRIYGSIVLLGALSVALLIGCTSLQKAPVEEDTRAKLFRPEQGKANIYVYREMKFMGSAGNFRITMDSKYVGELAVKTYYRLSVDPGEHEILAEAWQKRSVTIQAVEGESHFVSVKVGGETLNVAERVEPSLGMAAVRECCRLIVAQEQQPY